jgi:hypothetical protein
MEQAMDKTSYLGRLVDTARAPAHPSARDGDDVT